MENCLVTKLKATVQNDNLPKLNTIKFSVNMSGIDISGISTVNRSFYYREVDSTITCTNGKTFDVTQWGSTVASSVNTFTSAEDAITTIVLGAYDYVFEITPKYDIKSFGLNDMVAKYIKFDMSQLNFLDKLKEIWVSPSVINDNIDGTVNLISNVIESITLNRTKTEINIDNLYNKPELTTLTIEKLNTGARGCIESLSKSIKLTTLTILNTSISGDLKTLADAMVSEGRTSGTLAVQAANSSIKINSVPYLEDVVAHGGTYFVSVVFNSSSPRGYTLQYS